VRVAALADSEAEYGNQAARDRCCNLATVDARGRVRSRIVHRLWEGWTVWVLTTSEAAKVKHVRPRPFTSLVYVGDSERGWDESLNERLRAEAPRSLDEAWTEPCLRRLFDMAVAHPPAGLLRRH
jgi:general stress protein 26